MRKANQNITPAIDSISIHRGTENTRYFYHGDHLGSSSWITDKDGNALQYISYLPYGQLFMNLKTTSYDASYKFIGKERDAETGYDYFGARYYSNALGVWLSVDPLADARAWSSPYSYCQNNPVGRVDDSGMLDDKYFDENGNYLGDDNKGSNIRIIIKSQYNMLTDDGNVSANEVESVLKKGGVLFSEYVEQTNMSEESQLNVYEHFNPTDLSIENSEEVENMGFYFEKTGSNLKLLVNLEKNLKHADNFNNLENMFEHEGNHYCNFIIKGIGAYLKTPQVDREMDAFNDQMQHPSWEGTTKEFKEGVKKYIKGL